MKRAPPPALSELTADGTHLKTTVTGVEAEVYQLKNQSGQDPLNFPIKLNNRLASLLSVVSRGDGRPIAAIAPIFADLSAELKVHTERLQKVLATDLAALNAELRRLGLETVNPAVKPIA